MGQYKHLKVCVFFARVCRNFLSPVHLEENRDDHGRLKGKKAADGKNVEKKSRIAVAISYNMTTDSA